MLGGSQLLFKYSGGRSKNTPPMKKQGQSEADDDSFPTDLDSSDGEDADDFWGGEQKGKRRQQQPSDETAPEVATTRPWILQARIGGTE